MMQKIVAPEAAPGLLFAGYAALFDRPDGGGDIIRRSAFQQSLNRYETQGIAVPLLWQHRPDMRIGSVTRIAEDARGLRVVARLENPESRPARLLIERQLSGLSFGYRATRFGPAKLASGRSGRELIEVDLIEVSLVTRPMQHGARVHLVF